jgi:DNA-binding CsgD family transcriptional regulator
MSDDFHIRWGLLSEKQKEVARLAVKGEMKLDSIGEKVGWGRSYINDQMRGIYILLGAGNIVQLALLVGRHYDEVFSIREVRKSA